MKKLIIIVAAAIGLGLVSAHAGEIDFDGKTTGAMGFMETTKSSDSRQNDNIMYEQPKPASVSFGNMEEPVFSPRIVAAMDESIGSAIAYVNTHRLGSQLRTGFECLRDQGTLAEKSGFVYAADGSGYALPDRCMLPSTKGTCICTAWDWRDVCHDTTVYKDVCEQVAGVCAAGSWIGGVWTIGECTAAYMVCKAVATIIPSCIPVKYCSQQSGCGPTFG